jgi:hypothetical protein
MFLGSRTSKIHQNHALTDTVQATTVLFEGKETPMQMAKLLLVLAAPLVVITGCKKEEESPPPQAPYGQQPYGQPAPAPTYGQPAPAPAPAPAPGQPAPAPGQPAPAGTMSQPSPMALQCTSDANCFLHRCNTAVGKCAWPCQTVADCNPGNQCMSGACIPGAAPQQ